METDPRSSSPSASPVTNLLDDVIKFSLPALVSLAADTLFSSEIDRRCCRSYLEDVMNQLQLDDSTKKSVLLFLKRSTSSPTTDRSNGTHINPLVQAIRGKLWLPRSPKPTDSASRSPLLPRAESKPENIETPVSRTQDEERSEDAKVEECKEAIQDESKPEEPDQTAQSEPVKEKQVTQFYMTPSTSERSLKPSNEDGSVTPLQVPSPSPLNSELNEELAIAIVSCLIVAALIRGRYDARVRIVVRFLVHKFRLKWDLVEDIEDSLVEHFKEAKVVQSDAEKKALEKQHKMAKIKRIAAISVATVLGGVAIGVTGGLAAPAVFGAMGGVAAAGGFAAFMASTGGAALVGSLFGAVGAGLSGYKMNRRVGAVEEFEFVPLTEGQQLHLVVALPGWLSSEQADCRNAYYTLSIAREQYCLKFESKYLIELGNALDYFLNIATSSAASNIASEIAKSSAMGTVQLMMAWPSLLLSAANVIDNPWSVCLRRSAKAGEQLAEVLLKRQQGHRPVTLIGFSLGARAIFYCLREMSRDKHAAYSGGIVQNVILLGAPVSASPKDWSQFSRVVSGEIINGYARSDWLLKFLYRTTNAKSQIAGLGQVEWNDRRMFNIDLSHIISGHGDYLHKMDLVLAELGIGGRRKATLMSLAASRAVSNQQLSSASRNAETPKRSVTTSLAVEQLHLAEKMMSTHSLQEQHEVNISFSDDGSVHEAETLDESAPPVNSPQHEKK